MDFNAMWEQIKNFFVSNVWSIVGFFSTLVIGFIVINIILSITKRMAKRAKLEPIAQSFLHKVLKFALFLLLVLILLAIVGVQISGLITAFSAIVLAVGMALKDSIANIANGMIIVASKTFKKGDFIEVGGVSGSVQDINFLFTIIRTKDNKRIVLPNSTIVNSPLINYGAYTIRRVDFTFSVAYESDVDLVKKIVIDVMKSNGKVITEDHEPFCKLKVLNASSIDFFANCWVDSDDYWDVYYYVMENVFNEFKRNRISIPYSQLEVRTRQDQVVMPVIGQGLPERVEKIRSKDKKRFNIAEDNLVDDILEKLKTSKNKTDKEVDEKKENGKK